MNKFSFLEEGHFRNMKLLTEPLEVPSSCQGKRQNFINDVVFVLYNSTISMQCIWNIIVGRSRQRPGSLPCRYSIG